MRRALLLPLLLAACGSEQASSGPAAAPASCSPGLRPEALLGYGPQPDGSVVLHDGRRLTPRGNQVEIGSFPMAVVISPDGRFAYTADSGYGHSSEDDAQSISVIDLAARSVIQRLLYPDPEEVFLGLVLDGAHGRLYASAGAAKKVRVFSVAADGTLVELPAISIVGGGQPGGTVSGLALSPDGATIYAALLTTGEVVAFSTADGSFVARANAGKSPYGVRLAGGRLWVSAWSQARKETDPFVASFALPDLSDRRQVVVGKNPEGMAASPDGATLFVATSDGDTLEVIDAASSVKRQAISLRDPLAPGAQPLDVAISPDGSRAYVPLAGEAAVAVIALPEGTIAGKIPVGHYPSAVALTPDGATVVVTNAKGIGAGPTDGGEYSGGIVGGTASIFATPTDAELTALTAQVAANNSRPQGYYDLSCGAAHTNPIPAVRGGPTPIRHVIYVLRENKTYDQVFGDLEIGNSDPSLTVFGEHFTPNAHALAREFTLLDNCYSEAETSFQGHLWSVAGTSNDYLEKLWIGMYRNEDRFVLAGVEVGSWPAGSFIFQRLLGAGVEFRNYGELAGYTGDFATLGGDRLAPLDQYAPSPDLTFLDVDRAAAFARDLDAGVFPPFVFLTLPRDHTFGTDPGRESPEHMVAENDYATGLIVEAVSHSRFWKETAIFVTEDDPQTGADHVDQHRTVCLAISPWAKRHHVTSQQTSVAGLMATYEYILGLEPLSETDAYAAPLYDAFTDVPDLTPYAALPMQLSLQQNLSSDPGAELSAGLDFARLDEQPELGLALWARLRPDAPPPRQLVRQTERLKKRLARFKGGDRRPDPDLDGEKVGLLEAARFRAHPPKVWVEK